MGKATKQQKNREYKKLKRKEFLQSIAEMEDEKSYQVMHDGKWLCRGMFLPSGYWKMMFNK